MSRRERPILFSTEMVRAILEGRKWVTRRVVNPQPSGEFGQMCSYEGKFGALFHGEFFSGEGGPGSLAFSRHWTSPYGGPGELLYVREAWRVENALDGVAPRNLDQEYPVDFLAGPEDAWMHPAYAGKWRRSMHMPKWATRLRLHVSEVRVERVQDITENQARLEGTPDPRNHVVGHDCAGDDCKYCRADDLAEPLRFGFSEAWNQINAKRGFGWDVNPWVWVVEWNRVERMDTGESIERKAAA